MHFLRALDNEYKLKLEPKAFLSHTHANLWYRTARKMSPLEIRD